MNLPDYNRLKPHAKACGYHAYLDENPTIEVNQSSKLGIPALIFLTIGILRIGSEDYWKVGAINLFAGACFGISHLMWKENRNKLKVDIKKFKITKVGIVITKMDKNTIFINKNNIEGFEISDAKNPFSHKCLAIKKEDDAEEIILMRSLDATQKIEEALESIAEYAASIWNEE